MLIINTGNKQLGELVSDRLERGLKICVRDRIRVWTVTFCQECSASTVLVIILTLSE